MKKKEIKKAIKPTLLSENCNPDAIVQESGDYLNYEITKSNRKVITAKNRYGKRSATKYPNGTVVETISY